MRRRRTISGEHARMLQTTDAPPHSDLPPRTGAPPLDGILLTHAHIGHYLGLAHLGREVLGARRVPVYAMPRMRAFIEANAPWSQLVALVRADVGRSAGSFRSAREATRARSRISL